MQGAGLARTAAARWLVVLVAATVSATLAAGPLDGSQFKGELGQQGQGKLADEVVSFRDGKLHSVALESYSFWDAEYKATTEGGTTKFEATSISPREGRVQWKGSISGNALEAKLVWTHGTKTPQEYYVKATKM
ncbi:MAG: hypothetical protein KBD01_10360 [Acidobacteria bacterium]|nr:hypothetical protein [Acidobacteriota bacterium]